MRHCPQFDRYRGGGSGRRAVAIDPSLLPGALSALRHAVASYLRLLDPAKIETQQEEDEMHDGAGATQRRRLNEICSQQRHRNFGAVEVE
jgi:hypothetical protein